MSIGKFSLAAEAKNCLVCADAPCTAACPEHLDPAGMVRSVRFGNLYTAVDKVKSGACAACNGFCENACIHYDRPIRLREMAARLPAAVQAEAVDLSIDFCGIPCENPFFLSSSVVASNYDMIARAFAMGWAGMVYKTITLERINDASPRFTATGIPGAGFEGFKNLELMSQREPAEDFADMKRLKQAYPHKIIIASIMGQTEEEWITLAKMCEDAHVDAIELNFSCPHMHSKTLGADVGTNPAMVALFVGAARRATSLPLIAKMTPNVTNMEIPALAAVQAGANGLAAINTVKSITGIHLAAMAPLPEINGKSIASGYSGRAVKPIALRFIHDLATCPDLQGVPLSGMGGIESWQDAAEFLALGCTNLQVTTSVMEYGYRVIDDMLAGLKAFMTEQGYHSVKEIVGAALDHFVPSGELDRETVVFPLIDRNRCIGCGRCYLSCLDGGHQAIRFENRVPQILGSQCVGCHLCVLVCPVGAIGSAKRVARPARMRTTKGVS